MSKNRPFSCKLACTDRSGSYSGRMPVQFTVLGSGRSGNCAYLETANTRILIDAGFSGKQITARLAGIGRSIHEIDAIILTHEHTDHTAGLSVLCNRGQLPLYCNRLTAEAVREDRKSTRLNSSHGYISY